jgi:hypothetical protein
MVKGMKVYLMASVLAVAQGFPSAQRWVKAIK